MMRKRWGAIMRERGLAHLSRYLGAWCICGLEPHMQRQQLVQDLRHYVPDNVEGMLGHRADYMDVEIHQTTTSCPTAWAHSPQSTIISVDVPHAHSAQANPPPTP